MQLTKFGQNGMSLVSNGSGTGLSESRSVPGSQQLKVL